MLMRGGDRDGRDEVRGYRNIEVGCDVGRFVFFFQAEDGIRDSPVTGVQTCALPIFRLSS